MLPKTQKKVWCAFNGCTIIEKNKNKTKQQNKTKQTKTKTKTKTLFGTLKGTNGRQKTCEIFHVYCIFYSGFMCQTTVIFGITKDRSLVLNPLAS